MSVCLSTYKSVTPTGRISVTIGIACYYYNFVQIGQGYLALYLKTKVMYHTVLLLLVVVVFSPWAGQSRNQSPVRRPVWLWYAASWASS